MITRMRKEPLTAETVVGVANVVKTLGRERLVQQIAWFLMVTIAMTLALLVLHSLRLLNLPAALVEKLSVLFGIQIVALLSVIVRKLME